MSGGPLAAGAHPVAEGLAKGGAAGDDLAALAVAAGLAGPDAVDGIRRGGEGEAAAGLEGAEVAVVLIAKLGGVFVPAADGLKGGFAPKGAAGLGELPAEELGGEIDGGVEGLGRGRGGAVVFPLLQEDGAVDDIGLGGIGDLGELAGDFLGEEVVVGVDVLDPLAAGGAADEVARAVGAAVAGALDADGGAEFLEDGDGGVGGTVVDDDDFFMRVGLPQGALHGVFNPSLGVVAGNPDGDEGRHVVRRLYSKGCAGGRRGFCGGGCARMGQ